MDSNATTPPTSNPGKPTGSVITNNPATILQTPAPKDGRNIHVKAMLNWMVSINGGHLPAPGESDKAIDSLMKDIANISLDSLKATIPADVKSQVPNFESLTENALKSLVFDAAKLSVAEPARMRDNQPSGRCWTSGLTGCTCRLPPSGMPGSGEGGLHDDTFDVCCGLDCPVGGSKAEHDKRQEEFAKRQRECYSPCCGEPDCVCQHGTWNDEVWLICGECAQSQCICQPVEQQGRQPVCEYSPQCIDRDCFCHGGGNN